MFKTIFAPLGGSDSDEPVLDAALAIAKLFGAHIECFHGPMDAGEAAATSRHVPFLIGGALREAMDGLDRRGHRRAAQALRHYADFCQSSGLPTAGAPASVGPSVSMLQGSGSPSEELIFLARHHDLAVMSRPHLDDGLPPDIISRLLQESGQPLLLMHEYCPSQLPGRMVVCWKDTAASARAVTAALPLLTRARQVLLLCVDEGSGIPQTSIDALLGRLGRHGVAAELIAEAHSTRSVMETLVRSARAHHADLMVMGCYGHGPLHQLLLGGCTQDVLQNAEMPVFIAR